MYDRFGSGAGPSGVITLSVIDAETGEDVPGAVIEIAPKAHPDQKKYYTSGYKGALQVRGLAYGSYTLAVTFMGYEKAEKEFRVTQPSENWERSHCGRRPSPSRP